MKLHTNYICLFSILALAACSSDVRSITQHVSPGNAFFDLPFPEDSRILSLATFPNPANLSILDQYLNDIEENWQGYGTNSSVYIRFRNAPAIAHLPDAKWTMAATSPIQLVNIDSSHPNFGKRTPLDVTWRPYATNYLPDGMLIALPVPGFTLDGGTTYALIMSAEFSGWNISETAWWNQRLESSPGLTTLINNRSVPFSPTAGAIFTTQDPVAQLISAAEIIEADTEYPNLITWSTLASQNSCRTVEAYLDALNFQGGSKPYNVDGGNWLSDKNGTVLTNGTDRIRIILSVPETTMPASGWPTLLMAHGTGSDAESWRRTRCSATRPPFTEKRCAEELCTAGIASIGFEQPLHGERLPEDTPLDESVLTFNLFNIKAIVGNIRQGAADLVSLSRWLRELDTPATEFPLGEAFKIDPEKFLFMGHSQGTNTGIPYLALRGYRHQAAVLSGASGGLALALIYKTDPVDFPALLEPALSSYGEFDVFHPALAIFQTFSEQADTLNYGKYIQKENLTGSADWHPIHLFVSEGLSDGFTPPQLLEALVTAIGVDLVAPVLAPIRQFELQDKSILERPISGNMDGVSSVLAQYPEGHFSVNDNPGAGADFLQFLIQAASDETPGLD